MQELNNSRLSPGQSKGQVPANRRHRPEGVDKAQREENSRDNVNIVAKTQEEKKQSGL